MCFNKDSSSLLIFCHFSEKYDYLFGLGEEFGQFFWAPITVERYQNRPGYVPESIEKIERPEVIVTQRCSVNTLTP